jgi:hypothetical protein
MPSVYADMAAAIAASVDGDTARAAAGTYTGPNNRNLNPGGLNPYIIEGETGDPTDVIFDSQSVSGTKFISFGSGESRNVILKDLTIENNYETAGYAGAIAIGWNKADPIIRNCIIQDNQAMHNPFGTGGAIRIASSSGPLIEDCIIQNNSARYNVGGICCLTGSATIEINNCLIIGNDAGSNNGGGIYVAGAVTVVVRNTTISDNVAGGFGGGVHCENVSAVVDLYDCIIWGNSASTGDELNEVSGTLTLHYCCYQNEAGDVGGTPTFNNCITTDPEWIGGGDYHLNSDADVGTDSPCIDAGSDTAANLGLDTYTTRTDSVIDQGQVDIGYHYPDGVPPPSGVVRPFGNVNYLGGGVR